MSVLVVGECRGITTRKAGPNQKGEFWDETTIVVDGEGLSRHYARVASLDKFRGTLPEVGEPVVLDCKVDAYVRKSGDAGHSLIAFGRVAAAESALFVKA